MCMVCVNYLLLHKHLIIGLELCTLAKGPLRGPRSPFGFPSRGTVKYARSMKATVSVEPQKLCTFKFEHE